MSWWCDAVIYQIYPRSFADASGDGIGDLPGIVSRLDHLVDLGVDALWLSPFYPSPQADAGYDVTDYRDVDPLFGTLADFDRLVTAAHDRGLKVIVDLVPNHTSVAHPWFAEAIEAGHGSPERARYHFRTSPNDWQSRFGGPAWSQVPDGEWYLHLYDASQPDLNWDNPDVRAEFDDILRFWLDRGADGFRVDVAHGLVKGDQPWDNDGVHEIYRRWRALLDKYDGDRILVAEALVRPVERIAAYVRPDEMHQAFNYEYLLAPWSAPKQRAVIDASLAASGAVGAPTTWVLSNHDVVRHASHLGLPLGTPRPRGIGAGDPQPDVALGLRRARAATLLMLALPGAAYLYQGEELGLPEHTTLPDEARQDPVWRRSGHTRRGRDGCRVPIPWEADRRAYGFSPTGRSWLPQPPSWAGYAVDRQRGVPDSTLDLYRAGLRLRRSQALGSGALSWLDGAGGDVVAFHNRDILVLANLGAAPVRLPPGSTEVLLASGPLGTDGRVPADVTVWAAR